MEEREHNVNSLNYSLVLAGSAPFAKPLLQSPVKPATDYFGPEAASIAGTMSRESGIAKLHYRAEGVRTGLSSINRNES